MKKVIDGLGKLFGNLKNGVKRFPVTIIFSVLSFVIGVFVLELYSAGDYEKYSKILSNAEVIERWLFVGIFITAMFEIIREYYFLQKNKWLMRFFYTVMTGILLAIFNWIYSDKEGFWILIVISALLFLLIPILNQKYKEKYLQSVFVDLVVTKIFVFVFFIGISIILWTIQLLLLKFDGKWYFYSFLFISSVFGTTFFLSMLKEKNYDFENYEFPLIFKVLIKFAIIPLITIYTFILYIYLLKVIILLNIPKGMISHLVLWYTAFSLFVIILITPLVEKDGYFKNFRKYFPPFSVPLILVSLFAIFQRIYQYGVTENRYYIVILIAWLLFCMILYIIKTKVIYIFISLLACLVITFYSPLNSTKVSVFSQTGRLKRMLTKQGVLKDGKILKITKQLTDKQGNEIFTTIEYLSWIENVDKLNLKNADGKVYSKTEDLYNDLGVKDSWKSYYPYAENENYENENNSKNKSIEFKIDDKGTPGILTISDYDNLIRYEKNWDENFVQTNESDKYKVIIKNKIITISDKNGIELAKINYEDIAKQLVEKLKTQNLKNIGSSNDEEYIVSSKDLDYIGNSEKINYKISFKNIYESINDGKLSELSYEFNLLFSEKNKN